MPWAVENDSRENVEKFYSRSIRWEIKKLTFKATKNAEFVPQDLLHDDSAPTNSSQKDIHDRLKTFVNAGEDIVDLRMHNSRVPRYDEFWSLVSKYIEDRTAVSDRRHDILLVPAAVLADQQNCFEQHPLYRSLQS